MTKGTSTRRKNSIPGYLYGNFDPGDQDKLMITYERDPTQDYSLNKACGVIYQGGIHFFGGDDRPGDLRKINHIRKISGEPPSRSSYPRDLSADFTKQHLIIETHRSGKMVKMKKMKDLD